MAEDHQETPAPTTNATPQLVKLPEAPVGDFWTKTQWDVMLSLMDAILGPVVPESELENKSSQIKLPDAKFEEAISKFQEDQRQAGVTDAPGRDLLKAVLKDAFSSSPARVAGLKLTMGTTVHYRQRKALGDVMRLCSTRWGALLLTGYCTPIQDQPLHVREAIVRGWLTSRLPSLRLLAKTLITFAQMGWVLESPLFKQAGGYTDVPREWRPGQGFDFDFIQFDPLRLKMDGGGDPVTLETDVVIVGSGCGGGVCAKVLAEAGHRVLVVEKGYYFPPSQLPMPQLEGSRLMFENGGVVPTVDGSVNVAAGSTWGGGGAINWSVSLQTQGYVRKEWAQDKGLVFFETGDFQDCLDRVCEYMGAARGSEQNVRQTHRGQVLLDGCHRLGWQAGPLAQNSGGAEHWCGRCHLGCGSAEKQSPAVSWLPAAANAGARFIEGFTVDRITFGEGATASGGKKVATGIVGTWLSRDKDGGLAGPKEQRLERKVVVKAKKVIISAGSLWSPAILSKSGLKNRHIGRNLYLHPCNFVGACYKEDIVPWDGGIITSYCTNFEDLDGCGHGVKLEPTCQVPYTNMSVLPWRSGLDFKLAAVKYRQTDVYIVLTRDRNTGYIRVDPVTGQPTVHYKPSAFDRAHTLEGVIAISKFCYVMGATEIKPFLPGVEPFVRPASSATEPTTTTERTPPARSAGDDFVAAAPPPPNEGDKDNKSPSSSAFSPSTKLDLGINDPAFSAWLDQVRRAGNPVPDTPFMSAHQMGTCRMAASEGEGVVDPKGKVWEAENLYVADASVFPSASGVNPMVTIMAIADWIARGVSRELRRDAGPEAEKKVD